MWKIKLRVSNSSERVSCASLITSYVDNEVSDEDKMEALQALMQVFKSMADVTSRILVGAVAARRSIHIKDLAFKYKATEKNVLYSLLLILCSLW